VTTQEATLKFGARTTEVAYCMSGGEKRDRRRTNIPL
jgi:hypothetical protein